MKIVLVYVQGFPSGCEWLEILGVSQVEQGERRRFMCMSVARFTCVVPQLVVLCRCCAARMLSEEEVWFGIGSSLTCVQDGTPT